MKIETIKATKINILEVNGYTHDISDNTGYITSHQTRHGIVPPVGRLTFVQHTSFYFENPIYFNFEEDLLHIRILTDDGSFIINNATLVGLNDEGFDVQSDDIIRDN